MPEDEQRRELLEHTTKIVGAHVANNPIAAAELPGTFEVCRPGFEGVPFLGVVAMPVINRCHNRLDVVQNLADDEAVDPERGHVARRSAPQIVRHDIR